MSRLYISDEKKEKIKKLINEGYMHKEIAEMMGVGRTTVGRIAQKMKDEAGIEAGPLAHKHFPADLRPQWEALNKIGREYRRKKKK